MMVGAAWQQRTDYGDDDVEEKYKLGTLQVKVLRRDVNIRSNIERDYRINNVRFSPPASSCYLFYSLPLSPIEGQCVYVCMCVCVCHEGRWK